MNSSSNSSVITPVKRKRGRPKKVVSEVPSDQVRSRSLSDSTVGEPPNTAKPPKQSKKKKTSVVPFPVALLNPNSTGCLNFNYEGNASIRTNVIGNAMSKLSLVYENKMDFGYRICIKSFEELRPEFSMTATVANIFFMHVLFLADAMHTSHGKVSVFPVTIHTSEKHLKSKTQGFPCLAVHIGQFQALMCYVYPACSAIPIDCETLMNHIHYQCKYNKEDDCASLYSLSGIDSYSSKKRNSTNGFVLIPAHYIDVMKHFFVLNLKTRDLGDVLNNVYRGQTFLPNNFFSPANFLQWKGEARPINVKSMLFSKTSQTKLRQFNGQIQFGKSGIRWQIADKQSINYSEISFAYGVECWIEQLRILNTAYFFFTDISCSTPCHQVGLLCMDRNSTPPSSRIICISNGILID